MKRPAARKQIVAKTRPSPTPPARASAKASGSRPRSPEQNKHYDALMVLRNQIVSMVRNISASTLTSTKQAGEELADIGSDNFSREMGLAMMTEDGRKLAMIQEAMDRLAAGTYGTCSECGKKINAARLKALPYADLCVDCQGLQEEQEKMSQQSPMEFALFQEQEAESKEADGDEEAGEGEEEETPQESKTDKGAEEKAAEPSKTPPPGRGKASPPVGPAKGGQSKAEKPAPNAAPAKPAKTAPAKPAKVKAVQVKATSKEKTASVRPAKTAKTKPTRAAAKPAKSPAKRVAKPAARRAKVKTPKTAPAAKSAARSGKRAKK